MPATLDTITPILKEVYQPRIREQLNTEVIALKRIQRSSSGVTNETGGKYVTFPIHTRRNSGIGSRRENQPLPAPGQQGYAAARIGLKYAYGSIQLTGQAISLSDSDPKAFAQALDQEVNGAKNDVLKDMNRQVYGDGTGAIATVTAAGTGVNTITVDDPKLFQIGELVDIITLPSTVAVAARTVNSVSFTNSTVTLSGATFDVAVGQIIVRQGSGPDAAGNLEITGLKAIVSDSGVLYNIDPAVEPEWKSYVNSNGGTARALSEGLMGRVADEIRVRGGSTTLMLTSLGVRRAYANLLLQLRSVVNTTEFTGGFSGLAFTTDRGEIPLISDPDAPKGKIYFLNEDNITYYRDEDWHWLDRTGNMWERKVDANGVYDAWYANLVEYHELGTDRRNTHGLLADIIEE